MIGDIRAVASLTVPGGQEFHFPHFSPNFDLFFLFFLKLFSFSSSFWLSGWASRPPGKALATPLGDMKYAHKKCAKTLVPLSGTREHEVVKKVNNNHGIVNYGNVRHYCNVRWEKDSYEQHIESKYKCRCDSKLFAKL